MIFIAYNYDSKVIGIVNAKSKELANAFWQGKEITPNVVKCVENKNDFTPIQDHITGVYSIFEAEEKNVYIDGKLRKFLCVK